MQTCYNCGKSVSDETLICPDCGALVRRYTNTPPRTNTQPPQNEPPRQSWEQQPWNGQPQSWEQQPQQPAESHKVRFYGGIKFWLILVIVFSAYMAFNSLCVVFFSFNADVLIAMLEEPGMESYKQMLGDFVTILPQVLPLFLAMTVLFTAKLVCHVWLLRSGRKLPFYLSIGVSIVALGSLAILGGSIMGMLYFFDPFLTWLGLKRFWPWMQK